MIQIKRNNKVFYTIEDICEGSKLSRQLMDHHYVILKFSTEKPVYFEIGDSVEIPDFGYFELTSAYFPKYNDSTDGYDYELQMDAYYMAWKNKICKYRPQYGANETSFKLTTSVAVHLNVILGNLKALGYKYNGLDFAVDYTTYNKGAFDVDKRFYIEYGSISILDAINAICDENALDCEWWVDGNIIYLGYCEMTGQVTFEQGVNMLSMSYSESKSSYITRLYAFGSDKNIPTGYFTGSDADVTTDGIATDYLMLPNKEVDTDGFYSKGGYLENTNVVKNEKQAIEGVVMFDDEYPRVECAVSGIKTYDSTVEENGEKTTRTFWQVTSKDSFATNFTKSWIKRNLTLMIKFTSGALMGMEFDVEYKIIDQVNYFEIVANDTYGRSLPDGVMCPKEGDKFFLYNWDATKITETSLIQKAQDALYERAKVYYLKSMVDNSNFTCVLDAVKFYNRGVYNYHPLGEQVKLINPMFSDVDANGKHYRNSRIIGMDINLDIPYDAPTYIVGEQAASSRLSKLEDKVTSITVNGIQIGGTGSGGGGVYVIGLNDSTPATDSNVYSARRVDQNYTNKYREENIREIYTFAKGLISEMLAQLKGGATFGNNGYQFDKDGNVVVDTLHSLAFDEALEQGFGFTKNAHGKYTLSVTDLMVWGKAVFNSLEIRKLYSVGGNVYLSGASSKLQHVVPVTDADGEVTGWKCYILGDDGTTATQNGWARYDQAKCQTFDIKEGVYENVSNTYYWRLVTDVSTENEAITETRTEKYVDEDGQLREREVTVDLYDGKKFGWVILSKTDCESAANDAPKAGDTIVLDGHRMFAEGDSEGRDQYNDESRTNVMMLETTGVSDGSLPRIVALTGITDYRHFDGKNEYSNTVFILSPKEVVFVSSSIKWISASGDPITFVNFRGNWAEKTEYTYYDQVSHGNAIWTCIVKKGDKTTDEPSDTSKDWRKEISGGKDGKDGKSARRTAVVNLTSDSGTVFNGSYEGVLLRCSVVIDGKSMGGRIPRDNFSWTRDGQKILPDEDYRYRLASSSDALDLWKCSVKIPKRLLEPIELTALRADGNSLIFHASEDVSKMTLYLCRKRYCRISILNINRNINRNAWGFCNMGRDYPKPLPFTSLGDNNYSVDMSQLLSFVELHNIVLHKTAKVTTKKTALKHGKHTYWLKQGADGKYHAWGRYGVWLVDSNYTPVSTVAKCKIYVETDSDTSTTGTASLSV